MRRHLFVALVLLLLSASACSDDAQNDPAPQNEPDAGMDAGDEDDGLSQDDVSDDEVVQIEAQPDCDLLQPAYCTFPWPSSRFLRPDPSTPTGLRLNFGPTSLPEGSIGHVRPDKYNRLDGFALHLHALFHFPGLSLSNLPRLDDFESLDASATLASNSLVIEADSGQLVPHFAEHDERTRLFNETANEPIVLPTYLRGMRALKPATRYIVVLRNLVGEDGEPIEAEPAFAALRDGTPTDSEALEARRPDFEDLFATLDGLGIERQEITLAWDFTTGSDEHRLGSVIQMRDEALAAVEDEGFGVQIGQCKADEQARALLANPEDCPGVLDGDDPIAIEIEGTFEAPLFTVDDQGQPDPSPGTVLARDADGMPIRQQGSFSVPFLLRIPRTALTQQGVGTVLVSHGQLGDRYETKLGYMEVMAEAGNFVLGSVDLHGMASDDQQPLVERLVDFSDFPDIIDRQHQGLVNTVLMGRLMTSALPSHPLMEAFGIEFDSQRAFYYGASQGGIFGPSITALWPEARTGVFGVPGVSYPLILQRSVNYGVFENLLRVSYRSSLDQVQLLALAGLVWEQTEGAGFAHRLLDNPLPGSTRSEVLLLVALGDHQVANLGAEMMARTIGAPLMTPHNRGVWGLPLQPYPYTGSAFVGFDFGNRQPPFTNTPPIPQDENNPESDTGPDPHSRIAEVESLFGGVINYLDTHTLDGLCEGPCDPD